MLPKLLIKMLHKKVLDLLSPILKQLFISTHFKIKPSLHQLLQSCGVHALSCLLCSLFQPSYPGQAWLYTICTIFIDKNILTSLWPGFVQHVLDNKLSAFTPGPIHKTIVGLPELDKLIVRQTNWGWVHTVYQSVHLVYTVLSPC